MKVKRLGITEILRRIWLFSANEIKSSESFSKQPTQLIVKLNSSLRHIIVTFIPYRAHCSVSSNSFHGQITQKAVHQIGDPENKKCSHWNFFGTNHPQNLRFLSRRGPRSLDMGLSQHYIGSKMTFCHFSNFCRKKFPSLSKRLLHIFIQFLGL